MEAPALRETEVLLVDCQTTGANPRCGHLLEIAWARFTVQRDTPLEIASHLLQVPGAETLPPHIERLTGISAPDLARALCPSLVRESFMRELRRATPLVIHFARFELPFLNHLCGRCQEIGTPAPEVVCTHEICRRLLPRLPRRGLRAVAGYLGFPIPELKRARCHVEATARVWAWAVSELDRLGIRTREELARWLASPVPPRDRAWDYPMATGLRRDLPSGPGVYRMLGADGDLLYVGKATSLKRRVGSHFAAGARAGDRILEMLSQARRLEFTETDSVLEASLLEADEIKSRNPPYNRALRARSGGLYFASPDFDEIVGHVDSAHPVGPFASDAPLRRFGALLHLRRRVAHPNVTPAELFPRGAPLPPREMVERCLRTLFDGVSVEPGRGLAVLKSLGRKCIERRRARRAIAEIVSGEANAEPSLAADGPSPESVARYLEGLVATTFLLHNRARWFCRLADSSLRWSREGEEWGGVLAVEGARTVFGRKGNRDEGLPQPVRRSDLERKRLLDDGAYDRLRVLTTELRSLLRRRYRIELRLAGSRVLTERELTRVLQWL